MIIDCCKMTPVQSQYCMFSMIISCHCSHMTREHPRHFLGMKVHRLGASVIVFNDHFITRQPCNPVLL